jgi:type VI secretion system secreted protein Hcp
MAAVDYFLKLDGIDGESTDDKHKNWIEIDSFSWDLGGIIGEEGSRATTASKVSVQDFNFVSRIDKSTPILMLSCATGKHITDGVLIGRKAGERQQDFLVIKLTDILVSGFQTGGSAGDVVPTDQFSLNFAKIEFTYIPEDPTGKPGSPISAGFDVKIKK